MLAPVARLALAIVVLAGLAVADDASPPQLGVEASRVGFVDIELVMENSRALRAGLDVVDEQLAGDAREIDRLERDLRRRRLELDRQERFLTSDERERQRTELVRLQDSITRARFDFEQELLSKERLIEPVLEHIMNRVADVAEREGIDLVLRGEVVIYGSRTADLTEAVVREIDSREAEILRLFQTPTRPGDDPATPSLTVRERLLGPQPTAPPEALPLVP